MKTENSTCQTHTITPIFSRPENTPPEMPTERPPPRSRLFGRREAQAASQRRRVPSVRRTLRHLRRVGRVLRQGGALFMLCFGFVNNQIHDVAYNDTERKSIIPKKSFLCRGFSVPGNVCRVRCDAIEAFSHDHPTSAGTEEAEEAIAHAGVQVGGYSRILQRPPSSQSRSFKDHVLESSHGWLAAKVVSYCPSRTSELQPTVITKHSD